MGVGLQFERACKSMSTPKVRTGRGIRSGSTHHSSGGPMSIGIVASPDNLAKLRNNMSGLGNDAMPYPPYRSACLHPPGDRKFRCPLRPPTRSGIGRSTPVLDRLHARADREMPGLIVNLLLQTLMRAFGGKSDDHGAYVRDKLICIDRGQGWLIYMLCRGLRATRAVEFGTSFGVSTLYLAAAMRDQGAGTVIGTEIEPQKALRAREHFSQGGVADVIDPARGRCAADVEGLRRSGRLSVGRWLPTVRPPDHRTHGPAVAPRGDGGLRQRRSLSEGNGRLSGLRTESDQRLRLDLAALACGTEVSVKA